MDAGTVFSPYFSQSVQMKARRKTQSTAAEYAAIRLPDLPVLFFISFPPFFYYVYVYAVLLVKRREKLVLFC